MTSNLFRIAFVIIFFGQLTGRFLESDLLDYIFKPLIMPCLMGLLLIRKPIHVTAYQAKFQKRILGGFAFSWIGDVALMLEKFDSQYFILGLGSFLVAHLCYIAAFYVIIRHGKGSTLLVYKPYLFLPLLAYSVGFYYVLFPNLQSFAIPVLAYVTVICMMGCFALNLKGVVNASIFMPIFYGALWFMISDSLIALNKFMFHVPFGGAWVMLTYMIAQYQIMRGSVAVVRQ